MPPVPIQSFSPSSMSTFQQCQLKWKFRYVDKLPDPSGRAALVGTFVHRTLELLYQEPAGTRDHALAGKLAAVAWTETLDDKNYVLLQLDEADALTMRQEGWAVVGKVWDYEDPNKVEVLSTERKLKVEIGGVPFTGIVDRIDRTSTGATRIVDYKTGKVPWPLEFTQLLLYVAAVEATDGVRPDRAAMLFLKHKVAETTVNDDAQQTVVNELGNVWAEIADACEHEYFRAIDGPLCQWCAYVTRCPTGMAYCHERFATGKMRKDAPAMKLLGLIP